MGHSFIILLLIVTFSIFIIIDFAFINLHLTIFELNTLDFYVFTATVNDPGGFPQGITIQNIITHPSVPRNKLIAENLQHFKKYT